MKSKVVVAVAVSLGLGFVNVARAEQAISTAELLGYCNGQGGAFVTCEIYGQAVYDAYLALTADKLAPSIICVKQPAPSRTQVIEGYVRWAAADAKMAEQPAAQTILQFLASRFPC